MDGWLVSVTVLGGRDFVLGTKERTCGAFDGLSQVVNTRENTGVFSEEKCSRMLFELHDLFKG